MDGALLAARLLLALVFLIAGLGKLTDRIGSRQAITDFGLPSALASPLGTLLPLVEIAIAILLIPKGTAFWAAIAATALLALFIIAIAVNLARGNKPDCHCFGQVASGPIGWSTVARNVVLVAVAGLILSQGPDHPGLSAIHWFERITPTERIGLAIVVVGFALLLGQWGFLMNLLRQNGRLLERVETIENALQTLHNAVKEGGTQVEPLPEPEAAPQPVFGLPVGTPAPSFVLAGLYGETMTLESLRAQGQPVLLVFTDPGCGPCGELLPDIGRWQREETARLNVALISRGDVQANRAKTTEHGVRNVLLQQDQEVAQSYQYPGTPSALVVNPDGTIGTPTEPGPERIRALVQSWLGSAPAEGGAPVPFLEEMPTPLPTPGGGGNGSAPAATLPATAKVGDQAPDLELKDLDNKRINLSQLHEEKTVLVFWSLGCGFCQQMLPDLKEWEKNKPADAPRVILISSGSVEDNRGMALKSTVLLDSSFQAGQTLGAQGTPMGVLIDENGKIASEVAAGAPAVFGLMGGAPEGAQSANPAPAQPPGLKVGDPVPSIKLKDLDDREVDLAQLSGEKSLLVFWSLTCGFCQQMLPDLKEWEKNKPADAPKLIVISGGSVEDNRAMGLESTVLIDPSFQAGPTFAATGTPMGVLLDAEGKVASEVGAGAPGVFQLAGGAPAGSAAASAAPAAPAPAATVGQAAPNIKLPDLNGKTVNLSDFRGSETLVLFWNNGCGFCQQMLPDLKEWEKNKPKGAPKLLVVSGGSADENRALGLKSPVVLDDTFQTGSAFGAGGTPMGVLIDAKGNISSSLAAGAEQVLALASGSGDGARPAGV